MRLQMVSPWRRVGERNSTKSSRWKARHRRESRSTTMNDPSGIVGLMDMPMPYTTSNTFCLATEAQLSTSTALRASRSAIPPAASTR
jgi:hypothetical protein